MLASYKGLWTSPSFLLTVNVVLGWDLFPNRQRLRKIYNMHQCPFGRNSPKQKRWRHVHILPECNINVNIKQKWLKKDEIKHLIRVNYVNFNTTNKITSHIMHMSFERRRFTFLNNFIPQSGKIHIRNYFRYGQSTITTVVKTLAFLHFQMVSFAS